MSPDYNENDLKLASVVGGLTTQIAEYKDLLDRLDHNLGASVDKLNIALSAFSSACAVHRGDSAARVAVLASEAAALSASDKERNKSIRILRSRIKKIGTTLVAINARLAGAEREAKKITWAKSAVLLGIGMIVGTNLPFDPVAAVTWMSSLVSKCMLLIGA